MVGPAQGTTATPDRRHGAVHGVLLALCVFSLLGRALVAKSDKLSYHTGMTTLGRVAATAPDFNRNFLAEAVAAGSLFVFRGTRRAVLGNVFPNGL